MKRKVLFLIGLWLCLFPLYGAEILLEAESFTHKGGWAVDQQFMDQMGSPYLIAHGMGEPVADAWTEVGVPEPGTYIFYVRTYNWTSPWYSGEGPGRFQLLVNGRKIGPDSGTQGKAWMWQKVGKVKLSKTTCKLTLHDLTGFDGRCDAIFLTTDEHAVPPVHNSLVKNQVIQSSESYDLVVVGAGIAGMSAAVSAARLGLKVALLNDRPVLGGNNSSEIRVHLGGKIEEPPYPELGGLQKEFGPTRMGNAQPAENYEDEKKLEWIQKEKNVSLFLNQRAVFVEKEHDRITAVIAQHIEQGTQTRFTAPLFVDCTGDGTVGFLAGADWRMGREAASEFGESRAPEQTDAMTMGASVQWYSVEGKKPASFPEFHYGITFNEDNAEQVTMGEWTWETGMDRNQITEFERIRDYGMLVVYSNWSFLKNHAKNREEYRNRKLGWVAYVAGKRESRRLLGDYILHQDDLEKNVFHEDGTFITTWSVDLHQPDPENMEKFPGQAFKAITKHLVIYPNTVPYRCLYSRNVSNLFMAGRNISQTHVALGSTRVMRTTGMMGEVVGMAAMLCHKYGISPREIYWSHLQELKDLMRTGVNKKGLPNNQNYNEGGRLFIKPRVISE